MEVYTDSRKKGYFDACVLRGEKWFLINEKAPFDMTQNQLDDVQFYKNRLALNKPKEEKVATPEKEDKVPEKPVQEEKPKKEKK